MIYTVSDNSLRTKGCTWAWNIVEEDLLADLLSGHYPEMPLSVKLEGGTRYPDVLGCGAFPLLIVSKNTVTDWEINGVTGYEKFPLYIVEVKSKKLVGTTPPEYFHIKITGRYSIASRTSLLKRQKANFPTSAHLSNLLSSFDKVSNEFWEGPDLFVNENFPFVYFCSQKIFDLAKMNKRTNFKFLLPQSDQACGEGINYLKN